MTNKQFIELCLCKKGAYIDFPFGETIVVVKVKKRIFAQVFNLKGEETVTLNCVAEFGLIYRNEYPDIVKRGWHCPPVQQPYFNTMQTAKLADNVLVEMLEHSYKTVISKLPKYQQKELNEMRMTIAKVNSTHLL